MVDDSEFDYWADLENYVGSRVDCVGALEGTALHFVEGSIVVQAKVSAIVETIASHRSGQMAC